MKKISASVCALAVAALLSSSLSFADERGRQDEYQQGNGRGQGQNRGQGHDRGRDNRRFDGQFDQRDGRWNDRRPEYNARGPEFHRGGYISHEYRSRAYEVDYREHRLSRPPLVHRWVQVGADYVLIAIATGVIVNIILNH
jgi:Ni/Co efflux regulator RcnB